MIKRLLLTASVVGLLGSGTQAQYVAVGPGTTLQGDYFRGVGIAAWGMGTYNHNTAVANSINVDTVVKWNEYLAAVARQQTKDYVARKMTIAAQKKELYERERARILENPEARDIETGAALNAVLKQLEDSRVDESTLRSAELQVPLPADLIRQIPFAINETGEKFSMERLSVKGKHKWPPALQDNQFELGKKAYERALDKALEQAIDGKMQISAIEAVNTAVDELFHRLDTVVGRIRDPLFLEAKDRLTELRSTVRFFKKEMVERAIGDIDKYSGTTVNELRIFMQTHHLRFASAQTPEERLLFPKLYASLVYQRNKLAEVGGIPNKQDGVLLK
jgi:hypothetical protein